MLAWHWLRSDMRSGSGNESPWTVGERREMEGEITLCKHGYHASETPFDGLQFAPGSNLCRVEVEDGKFDDIDRKAVSRWRRLIAAADCSRELRLFACDCAERALMREREDGHEPDPRSWAAVEMARRYADGRATTNELEAARDAAWAAAWDAAWAAAWDAARTAAKDAAWDAERDWQRARLNELVAGYFTEETHDAD